MMSYDSYLSQVNFKNQYLASGEPHPITKLPLERVIKLVKDAFASATERHIEVGDGLEIYIVDRDGVRVERSELKKD
jgi:20S proteasome subunit beta 6